MPNIFRDSFTGRLDLSSEETAMYAYDLEPGDSLPYHYEYVEEWLLVVDGLVVVRVPEGELFSKTAVPAVSVYPDTDTVGVWPDDDTEFYFKRGTSVSREDAV
jgi:hypothetical protein